MAERDFQHTPNAWALLPLWVFLFTYLVVSCIAGDFYKMPITVAFVLSSVVAIAGSKGGMLQARVEQFCRGAANSNIMLMVLIFILAGAFAQTAKEMGAVDATVNLAMSLLPGNLLAAGIFIAACFISISVGTSVGTIVALAPVAVGIADKTGMPDALMLGVVVSGAMFGDNLSFISDTTIVATRTQGCQMTDKFKVNSLIALPIALLTTFLYVFLGNQISESYTVGTIEWPKVVPYLVVLITALCGMNVMRVLFIGILLSGIVGLFTHAFDIWGWTGAMGQGITGMGELIIVTLLAGGMLEMIRYNGGIEWIINKLTARIRSARGAEASIASLVSFANLCTANSKQHHRPHHGRAYREGHRRPLPHRPAPQRQPPRHLLLLRPRHYPLRGTDADGGRTGCRLPHRNHAILILSLPAGLRRNAGDSIPLSAKIQRKSG